MINYRLARACKLPTGIVRHDVILPGNAEGTFRYHSIRIAVVWPSNETPAYFLVGGEETWDEAMYAADRGVIKILHEEEVQDLSLNTLFDSVTSAYTMNLADVIYVDFLQKDLYLRFWEYLDGHNLRKVNLYDVSYKENMAMRLGLIADLNNAGELIIDKGSPLFQDLQGVSRAHLADKPESKYFRLNCLSYLIAGFSKYPSRRKLKVGKLNQFGKAGWMQ